MKLYYSPGACSLADHIALIELGLPHDRERVDLKAKTTETGADFTAINPKVYVPALVLDDGQVLTENVAVLSYLASGGAMMAGTGMAHWRMLETLAFVSTELHKNFKPFFAYGSDEDKAAARDLLGKRFAVLEAQLGDRDFIVGDTMSVADCYLFVMLHWAVGKAGITLPARLAGLYARLQARPAVKQALAEEGLA